MVEDDGEPDAAVDVVGWRQALFGECLGDGRDAAGQGFDDAGAGFGGPYVLADGDESGVACRGDGVAAEPVDGDAVQTAGIRDDEAVAQ